MSHHIIELVRRIDAVGKADAEDEPADGDDPAALMNRFVLALGTAMWHSALPSTQPRALACRVREIEELQETAAKIQAIHAFNGFPGDPSRHFFTASVFHPNTFL